MMAPVQNLFSVKEFMRKFELDLIAKKGMYKRRCRQEFSVMGSFSNRLKRLSTETMVE